MKPTNTPETDAEIADIIPTNDPNYEGTCEWVPVHVSRRLERERNEALAALDASNDARAMVGERWLALDAALREIKRCPGRSCQTDRIASIALEKHGQRVIEIPKGGGGGFSVEPSSAEKEAKRSQAERRSRRGSGITIWTPKQQTA